MNLNILLKHLYALFFRRLINNSLQTVSSDKYNIITYHRILQQKAVNEWVEPGMYVKPETLQLHIKFFKKYFTIVGFDEIQNISEKKMKIQRKKPFCVLSFDDGWKDFYTHAWPVLQKENVPAIVYLPTAFIGSDKSFWTDRIARLLKNNSKENFCDQLNKTDKMKMLNVVGSYRHQLSAAITILKRYSYQRIEEILDCCEKKAGIMNDSIERTFMNWKEIRELFDSGLVSFGSHTVNHAILDRLSINDIHTELMLSRKTLLAQKIVGESIAFCYPNGNYTNEIADLVAKEGYSLAMTCDSGWNKKGDSLFSLKRISLHEDISFTESLLAYRLVQSL